GGAVLAPGPAPPDRGDRARPPPRLHLRLSYLQAVQDAGGLAVVLPAHGYIEDQLDLLDRVDGLIFSGGPDLEPATYGPLPHPLPGPNRDRVADEYELAMHTAAKQPDLPRLAICPGMQTLNAPRGGTL